MRWWSAVAGPGSVHTAMCVPPLDPDDLRTGDGVERELAVLGRHVGVDGPVHEQGRRGDPRQLHVPDGAGRSRWSLSRPTLRP